MQYYALTTNDKNCHVSESYANMPSYSYYMPHNHILTQSDENHSHTSISSISTHQN